MAWDDVRDADSCITPTEWNDMITYIKATECESRGEVTFYLYTNCNAESGQEFKFSIDGDFSIIEGDDTSGQDLRIKASTADTYPYMDLCGDSDISLHVKNNVFFYDQATQMFRFSKDGDDSILYGGDTQYDDLWIITNTSDTYPFIHLEGDGSIYVEVKNDTPIVFKEATSIFFLFTRNSITSKLYGGDTTGNELELIANSADTYPYILLDGDSNITLYSTADISFYRQANEMFRFRYDGSTSSIWGSDVTTNDLYIYANRKDSCPIIELFGNSGISNKIKYGGIFDVSTCSGETLFEIDTSVPTAHVDFNCLEAWNFVLELRTSDPSSPTCIGMIWFRTDLV